MNYPAIASYQHVKRNQRVQHKAMAWHIGLFSVMASLLAVQTAAAQSRCAELTQMSLAQARVVSALRYPAGRFVPSVGAAFDVSQPCCRVEVIATPTPSSEIRIEVWLPDSEKWNGRFWGLGNGSFGGQISHRSLGVRLAASYAVVVTDTGHQAQSSESAWALGHPERVADYGHRAAHLAAVHGQAVTSNYFGRKPDRSYFSAYSNGGRMALMLFMAPGVEHGVSGPGPDRFGQLSSGDGDAERSLGAAKLRWV